MGIRDSEHPSPCTRPPNVGRSDVRTASAHAAHGLGQQADAEARPAAARERRAGQVDVRPARVGAVEVPVHERAGARALPRVSGRR